MKVNAAEAIAIRLKKNRDGSASFTCIRPDGSATWQRHEGGMAHFFPLHDLTHYAVETVLHHRMGFYGLVAEGWDLTDFGTPWPRGPIPGDADPSELIVGMLGAEEASGQEWTAAEMNEQIAAYYAEHAPGTAPPSLTQPQLDAVRQRRQELYARWGALPVGETLELLFASGSPGERQ